MKVKFIKSPVGLGLGYFKDDVADFAEKQAADLVSLGYAVTDFEEEKPEVKIDLSEDIPGRAALLKAEAKTMNELHKLNNMGFNFSEFKGIGKALAKQIKDYLEFDSKAE